MAWSRGSPRADVTKKVGASGFGCAACSWAEPAEVVALSGAVARRVGEAVVAAAAPC